MRGVVCGGLWILIGAASGLQAQQGMGNQQQNIGANQSIMAAIVQPVTGEAYQAKKVTRSVQKLGDGTVITHETNGLIARDAEGRIREDLYVVSFGEMDGKQRNMSLQSATVGDPVSHSILIWTDEKAKVAMKMDMPSLPMPKKGVLGGVVGAPPPPPPPGVTRSVALGKANAADKAKDASVTEDLGKQSLEGILVTGKRTTTTIPMGEIGNDRPIVVVHEEWRSPELNILVKTLDSDPRTGEQTMVLEGLVRTDPDAALFHAPDGYTVQDMAELMKNLGSFGRSKAQ